jgi:para-aminobenzoate synthetase/4-amino-4-deoxychorismate lyase
VPLYLERLAAGFPPAPRKVRLLVSKKGALNAQVGPVEAGGFADLVLARAPVEAANPFLYHKTTHRRAYQEALDSMPGAVDVLLYNEKGQITESTLANVALEEGGRLYTPPVRCGLLPGTCRAWLLEQKRLYEKPIAVAALLSHPKVWLFNAVRGLCQVKVIVPGRESLEDRPPGKRGGRPDKFRVGKGPWLP